MGNSESLSQRGIGKIELLIIVSILAVLAAILVPNYMNSAARGPMMSCHSNLRNINTAIEMYAEEHKGNLPESLSALTPKVLVSIPLCQDNDTYSTTYQIRAVVKEGESDVKAFSVYCGGDNHSWYLEPNMPCFDSEVGLLQGPDKTNPFAPER